MSLPVVVIEEQPVSVIVVEESLGSVVVIEEEPISAVITLGEQGPPGPPGPSGAQGSQTRVPFTAQTVVTVTHNQSWFPNVLVVDNSGAEVDGAISYTLNSFTVSFNVPLTGEVVY